MIIPYVHEFPCKLAQSDGDSIRFDITSRANVLFITENDSVFINDREQVTLMRDMLTAWLSSKVSE